MLSGIAAAFNEELSYSARCAKLLGISGPDDPNPLVKMAMVKIILLMSSCDPL